MSSGALASIEAGLREDPAGALVRIERFLAEQPAGTPEYVRGLIARSRAHLWRHDLVACSRAAAEAERACVELGDPPELRMHVARMLANLLTSLGMTETALETVDAALRQGPQGPSAEVVNLRINRASLLRTIGRVRDAAAAFDDLVRDHLGDLDPDPAAVLLINAASTWWQVHRLDDASRALDQAQTLLGSTDTPLQAWVRVIRSWIAGARGQPQRAAELAREALEQRSDDLEIASSAARAWLASVPVDGHTASNAQHACETVLERCNREARFGLAGTLGRDLATRAREHGDPASEARYLRIVTRAEHQRAAYAERQMLTHGAARLEVLSWQLESDALRSRVADLAEQNARLEVLAASRAQLLKSVAHDLRSPLTAVMLGLDALCARHPGPVVEDMQHAARQMDGLLDAALSDEAVQRGEAMLTTAHTDMADVVREAVRAFVLPARRDQLEVGVHAPESLFAAVDEAALRRIVHNVVGNAIKFSPPGTRVEVGLSAVPGAVELTVRDRGPGFGTPNPERLLLSAARAAQLGVEGHGIGLHTVYQLTTAHGGTVSLADREDGGAEVTVRLPTPT